MYSWLLLHAGIVTVKGVLDFKLANLVNLELTQYFFLKKVRINDISEWKVPEMELLTSVYTSYKISPNLLT
jgi:hypothetical protein